jgi:hypothetical protein
MQEFPVTGAVNGLTVTLEPGQYTASYNITPSGCAPAYEQWIVPASPATVNLGGVRSILPPVPYSLVSPTWLAQDGATVGQSMCFLSSGQWGPGNCGGGSGGMTWPAAAGLPVYGGSSAWGTSLNGANGLYGVTFASAVPSLTTLGTAATATLGTSGAQVPLLNGANTWSALQTVASVTGAAGVVDLSGEAHTRPAIVVATAGALPATCAVGELAFVSGATAGQQIYECSTANVWTQQTGGGGGGGSAPVFGAYASRGTCTSGNVGQMFFASEISSKKWICDGNAWQPVAFDMQVVEPTTLTWAAAGESTTPTITSVAGALVVSATASGRWQVAATPISLSTPYTIEVAFTYSSSLGANDGCGLALFSSTPPTISGPTWMAWFIGSTASQGEYLPQFRSVFYDEWGDVMGDYWVQQVVPVIREKLVDDGTNRTFYLNNGAGYFQVFQQSDATNNTPHLPGYWGVGCGVGSGGGAQLVLYSASVHH